VTGSPMREVLDTHLERIKKSDALKRLSLEKGRFFLASIHREENVDSSESLTQLINALEALVQQFDYPVVVSTHPRTRNRLEKLGRKNVSERIQFLKPFGFLDYVNLQMNAACVISDSGTICEESSILDFPAITARNAIERPEAMDTGSIVVTGLDSQVIVDSVRLQMSKDIRSKPVSIPQDYMVENTSERVLKLIMGLAKLSPLWDNIRFNDLS
jgi:UDP-N-acetylglucosamine 2-epimerase (non-hydrolysing)